MATAKATTNHDEIRKWVEARKGRPARVKATGRGKDPGILRIDFPGFSGEDTLEEIEWDEFFEWFDKNNLALLLSSERGNRFNKLVERSNARGASSKKASSAKKTSTKKASSSAKKSSGSKSSAKKSSAKKATSAKKSSASSAKKESSLSKKPAAKKSASSRKSAAKKSPAKKTSAKKSTTKKAAAPRRAVAPARKSAAKKSPAKKSTAKKSSSKKPAGSSITTTDHDEIRKWVEARGGFPATVAGTESREDEAGVLRIDYPGFSGAGSLERIEWDDWFEKFDEEDLAFVYQNKRNSRFSKLVRR